MQLKTLFRTLFFLAALAGFAPAAGPVTIWVSSDADLKYYQSMVQLYQQKVDKNFQANIQAYGFTEMPDKLAVAIKSGINAPDIVQFEEIFFSLYLKGEIPFVDLTDRIAASPLGRGILPQRMGIFSWKGRTYGVPQSLSSVVLWYRADMFKSLGITPKDIGTWDKFEAVGRSLKGKSLMLTALDWSYLDILLRQRGYDLFNAEGKPFPDSAVTVQTWKRLVGWERDSVAFIPDRGGIFESSFFNNYVNGSSVLSMIGPDWYGLDIIQNFDTTHVGKWRAMPLPVWTDSVSRGHRNTSSFSGQGLVIFKKSPQVERSWKFIEWVMTDADANVARYQQGNSFTAYRPAWTDLRFSRPNPYFGNQDLAQLFTDIAPGMPYTVQSPLHAMLVNLIREQYFISVVHGETSPEAALSAMRAQIAQMTSGQQTGKKP